MTTRQGAAPRRRPLATSPGDRPEDGFTLLELILVLVVLAALMFIAVPSFATAQRTAQDHAAQADLRHALEAANTAYVDLPDYSQFSSATLAGVETALSFSSTTTTSRGIVAVYAATAGCPDSSGCIALAEPANDGTCWYVVQSNDGAPLYGKGPDTGGSCDASSPQNLGPDFPA